MILGFVSSRNRSEVPLSRRHKVAALALAVVATAGLVAGCNGDLPGNAVARVGEAYISDEDFTRQVEDTAAQYGVAEADDPEYYKQLEDYVLDNMIQSELAAQKAAELGVTVTDDELQAEIDGMVAEYYNGDQSLLESDLEYAGMTMEELKAQYEDFLLTQKVYEAVTEDIATVSDEEIEAYYEENKANYLTEGTLTARHILIAPGVDESTDTSTTSTTSGSNSTATTEPTDAGWAAALVTAAQLRVKLLAGGDWTQLAKQYSDDASTKDSGGDLGTVNEGDLVDTFGQEFEDALFALDLEEISEPVKATTGYHIIQVTALNEARQQTLGEAKDDITSTLVEEAKYAAWLQWIEDTKAELGVVYRSDMQPTTTTTATADTVTAIPADLTSTTAAAK
jgi:foldase protein PrsA